MTSKPLLFDREKLVALIICYATTPIDGPIGEIMDEIMDEVQRSCLKARIEGAREALERVRPNPHEEIDSRWSGHIQIGYGRCANTTNDKITAARMENGEE